MEGEKIFTSVKAMKKEKTWMAHFWVRDVYLKEGVTVITSVVNHVTEVEVVGEGLSVLELLF